MYGWCGENESTVRVRWTSFASDDLCEFCDHPNMNSIMIPYFSSSCLDNHNNHSPLIASSPLSSSCSISSPSDVSTEKRASGESVARSQLGMISFTTCFRCRNEIFDPYILQVEPDMSWHQDCLKCAECSIQLDENTVSCYFREKKTYCKDCVKRSVWVTSFSSSLNTMRVYVTSASVIIMLPHHHSFPDHHVWDVWKESFIQKA